MIENLHLSYDDVVYRIPYKTLMIMQKDKVQVVTGDSVVVKTTGKAMAARRMAAMRKGQSTND